MIHTAKKPNDLLCRLRRERGWSQRKVADLLRDLGGIADAALIGKWERGEHIPSPFYQEKLCTLFGLTAYELGFVKQPEQWEHALLTPQLKLEHQPSPQGASALGSENMLNKKRRELLQMLVVATTTLILPLPDLDWDRVEHARSKPSRLDEAVLRDLATINKSFWNLYKTTPQKQAMLDGVLGQLKSITGFLEQSYTATVHEQLCILASDLSQLLGEILFDGNDYESARACYTYAAEAAKEAKHYDLWSCSLVRHAFLPIYEGQYQDALPLLQGAQKLAFHGDTTLATRYWVAAVSADVQAGLGNLYGCQQALDLMDKVSNVKERCNGGWLRFDSSRLLEQRGACFVKLKQPNLAKPILRQALQQDITYRRRGMILTDLALASLQEGNIDQSCSYAQQAVDIAAHGSGMLRKSVFTVRQQLEPYIEMSAVTELDQRLHMLA